MIAEEIAIELFREYRKTNDITLRNKLVENYYYIAEILAKKFAGRGVEYDDLLQIASEALISGIEKFDPEMGVRFTTFITPTVTGIIKNYFRDYSRSIRMPRRIYALRNKVRTYVNEYYRENGVKPNVKQIADKLDLSEESVIEALECQAPISLDSTVDGEEGSVMIHEIIADPVNAYERFDDLESLREEISKLDKTEQKVITLRFIEGKSQSEVGKILGVSQMFISRAERKIMEKLKEALG